MSSRSIAAAGLAVLILAQWRAGDAELRALLGTSIGRAWIARAIALVVAGVGVAVAAKRPSASQPGAGVIWIAACAAIAVHGYFGHAAAGRWPVAPTVAIHAVHVAAAGMWIGGLVVVVAGLRGEPHARARGLARYSKLAAIGLALVACTGVARSVHELAEWNDLITTTYGRLVIAKVLLLIAIAGLGAINRWRHLPTAVINTWPLRRAAAGEVALATLAIVAAAALATLPPPAAVDALPGIDASGTDFATTVKARLVAVSDQPGPNRFTVTLEDYDSGEPISPERVSLRFSPIDDPAIATTTLALSKNAEGLFSGTGANVVFDGRWRVNVLIEQGAGSAEVPLEFEAKGRQRQQSTVQVPGKPAMYRIEVEPVAVVQLAPARERPGETELQISWYGNTTEPLAVRDMVVTAESREVPMHPLVIKRIDQHQFIASASLERGRNRIVVIARTDTGTRLRATFELQVSNGD
jgi:putative copper export protein